VKNSTTCSGHRILYYRIHTEYSLFAGYSVLIFVFREVIAFNIVAKLVKVYLKNSLKSKKEPVK